MAAFYASRTPGQFAGIEAVAMDMWEPSSKPRPKPFLSLPPGSSSTASTPRSFTKRPWISSKENVHPKRRAAGHRNANYFTSVIDVSCGGLQLYR